MVCLVYTYDNNGNILSETIYPYSTTSLDLDQGITYSYGYSSNNWHDQLTSYMGYTITYDIMGNPLTYWNGTQFTWDYEGNLASIIKGDKSISYTYNDEGIRTSKTIDGVIHTYTLEGTKILSESYGNVLIIYLYDENNSPIGMAYRESTYASEEFDYYLFTKNLQGDILNIYDVNGALVASYTYDAWGNQTVTNYTTDNIGNINPFRYRGYYQDLETGFYYLNSRYYDPQVKRFISPDDIGYLGANGDLQAYNLYAYCSNNPVMNIDPMGTLSWKSFWKNVGNWFKNTFGAGATVSKTVKDPEKQTSRANPIYYEVGTETKTISVSGGDTTKPISVFANAETTNWASSSVGVKTNYDDFTFQSEHSLTESSISHIITSENKDFSFGLNYDRLESRAFCKVSVTNEFGNSVYMEIGLNPIAYVYALAPAILPILAPTIAPIPVCP